MANLTTVPSLDEVASDPARAAALPANVIQALFCRCVTLQSALLGAMLSGSPANVGNATEPPDSLIDVQAAAQRLGVSRDWIYHHAEQLPFMVRQGRLLRFSTSGISRYIRRRQAG